MLDMTTESLSSLQLRELKKFGSRVNKFGVNFAACDANGEVILLSESGEFTSTAEQLTSLSLYALEQFRSGQKGYQFDETNSVLTAVLKPGPGLAEFVALIDLGENPFQAGLNKLCNTMLGEMLEILAENFQAIAKSEQQIDIVSGELAQVYEELVLLHKLSTNMKVTETDANFLQMACDSLTDIVLVEGIAVLVEKIVENEKQLVLAAGSGLIDIDNRMATALYDRLAEEINSGKEALLDSEVDSPFRYDWPDSIKNIIAVPLCGKDKTELVGHTTQNSNSMIGLMVAVNRIDKRDFDSTDAKLFNSVANGCAVFIENGRLFKDLKELFIGSLKALTSSIDAKDQYTHGHSERVAFISRWIAEKFSEQEPLKEEHTHRIYLAGLLHDIGKIGVDESILRKKGKLTEQELGSIRAHPSIGASILSEIKQMRDIIPGLLCHHERVDGKGYPNGLAGEQIPLIAKIVGLADSFDAMTSRRTYRDAMDVEEALAEIEKNLGTQFDEKISRVFINSDVYQLWDIIQDGFKDMYGSSNIAEYGTLAVGSIIR